VLADQLKIDRSLITADCGRSDFPPGPASGGSVTARFITPAIREAGAKAMEKLAEVAGRAPKNEEEWTKSVGPVGGMIEQCFGDLQKAGEMTEHDHQIGQHIRHIFVKADTFEEALEKERAAFPALLANGLTVSRIKHMIDTGKTLKN
jgi:CO/xanthine dehydrogenase Mo-binding subunit